MHLNSCTFNRRTCIFYDDNWYRFIRYISNTDLLSTIQLKYNLSSYLMTSKRCVYPCASCHENLAIRYREVVVKISLISFLYHTVRCDKSGQVPELHEQSTFYVVRNVCFSLINVKNKKKTKNKSKWNVFQSIAMKIIAIVNLILQKDQRVVAWPRMHLIRSMILRMPMDKSLYMSWEDCL